MSDDIVERLARLETRVEQLSGAKDAELDVLIYWIEEYFESAARMKRIQENMLSTSGRLSDLYRQLNDKVTQVCSIGSGDAGALLEATQQMAEIQTSFNLQYLQLQNSMQNENRQFTMVSNIMKTKHDTVKNTISNIR